MYYRDSYLNLYLCCISEYIYLLALLLFFLTNCNILYLLQNIVSQDEFDYEILLWTIHIYQNICVKHANMIDNYIYLFGSIYVSVNIVNDKYISENFLTEIFCINGDIIKKMIKTIDNYIDNNDIYFGDCEKNKIIDSVKCID